jgi:hypothetical protein
MTWFGQQQEDRQSFNGTNARQRWEQLRRDSRQAVSIGEYYVAVLWPMSGWQLWKRNDKIWMEYKADCDDLASAIKLAGVMAKEAER